MGETTAVQLSFSDKPKTILATINDLLSQRVKNNQVLTRLKKIPLRLFLIGLPFLLIDLLLKLIFGYNAFLFIIVTVVLWFSAILLWITLRRSRVQEFPPRYQTTLNIIHTLRDDIAPKRNLFGQLDLTGAQQEAKLVSETPNALGLTVQRYRDEWLMLKTKLYDGNMLRLSAIERKKVRKGYWKRGSSGKLKWKPEIPKEDRNVLQVRLSVNPQFYEIIPDQGPIIGQRFGSYLIDNMSIDRGVSDGGIVSLSATTMDPDVKERDILNILKDIYRCLKRKD